MSNATAPQGNVTAEELAADLAKNQLKATTPTNRDLLAQLLNTIAKLDFNAELGLEQGEQAKQKHAIVLIIEKVLETAKAKNWGLAKLYDYLFCFNGKYWQVIQKEELKNFLGEAAAKMGYLVLETKYYKFRDELYQQFSSDASFSAPDSTSNCTLINLQNGTLEITGKNKRLRLHKPDDFLRYALPFSFDQDATAPQFQNYLLKVLPDETSRQVLAEYMGYIFAKDLKLEKMLLLYGGGANGKGVFFDIMNALLGKENIGQYNLSCLSQEHNRAQIANKLLNYASEINAKGIEVDQLKTLVSGEPIQARQKYGNSFIMEDYARLCFNCNELPKEVQHNEAYFRRFLIVPFDVTISESERDQGLAKRIIQSELAGVLNWVLEGLDRLIMQQRFTDCPKAKAALDRYKKESDSAWLFMDELGYKPGQDLKTLADLYAEYRTFCTDSGFHPLTKVNFSKRIKVLGFISTKRNVGQVFFVTKSDASDENDA